MFNFNEDWNCCYILTERLTGKANGREYFMSLAVWDVVRRSLTHDKFSLKVIIQGTMSTLNVQRPMFDAVYTRCCSWSAVRRVVFKLVYNLIHDTIVQHRIRCFFELPPHMVSGRHGLYEKRFWPRKATYFLKVRIIRHCVLLRACIYIIFLPYLNKQ
jgi:hypothetical protein